MLSLSMLLFFFLSVRRCLVVICSLNSAFVSFPRGSGAFTSDEAVIYRPAVGHVSRWDRSDRETARFIYMSMSIVAWSTQIAAKNTYTHIRGLLINWSHLSQLADVCRARTAGRTDRRTDAPAGPQRFAAPRRDATRAHGGHASCRSVNSLSFTNTLCHFSTTNQNYRHIDASAETRTQCPSSGLSTSITHRRIKHQLRNRDDCFSFAGVSKRSLFFPSPPTNESRRSNPAS